MEPEFHSEDFFSFSLGGGGRCFPVPCSSAHDLDNLSGSL